MKKLKKLKKCKCKDCKNHVEEQYDYCSFECAVYAGVCSVRSSRNKITLQDFVEYCLSHPEQRFWQALRNWSGAAYIFYADKLGSEIQGGRDTFYWEGKRG